MTNDCGHEGPPSTTRLCPHVAEDGKQAFVGVLTDRGVEFDACCPACEPPVELLTVCEDCAKDVNDLHGHTGWRGEPEIAQRPEPVDRTLHRTPLPDGLAPLDFAALPGGRWLLLLGEPYRLVAFDPADGSTGPVLDVPLTAEEFCDTYWGPATPALHTSPHGRFAAVVHDHGATGVVVDLTTGRATLDLHRGDHCTETTPFPIAFVDGLVCHASEWDEVTWSDPATGGTRSTTQPITGLFHGRLVVSPTGRRIADDGWAWHPVGVPHVWDLDDLAEEKPLCWRDYWNVGMCWVGDDLLAVGGIGDDEDARLDGVQVFDAVSRRAVRAFAGPRGTFFADGERLYSVTDGGVEVWDPATGHRTGEVLGFVPTRQRVGELAALVDGVLTTWKTISTA
ncbi:MAG: hypothetical protein ABIQ18_10160 [Umezawaea sp.]